MAIGGASSIGYGNGNGNPSLPPSAAPSGSGGSTATSTLGIHAPNSIPSPIASNASPTLSSGRDYLNAARTMSDDQTQHIQPSSLGLAPRSQSVAAVAEEEWQKQGIGFKARAEQGTGYWQDSAVAAAPTSNGTNSSTMGGGSSLLADLIQQNLIHDQYDRAIMEQDQAVQSRMDAAEARAKQKAKINAESAQKES
eukprot:CAMPEP_0197254012 /NCGR_PEP_ID=MMETSP1429-20130617/67063_1 /TAXON_ID=49237 /ORGANISM="Chaetoceros  sp., Strain UNC1202" /LENGTH=195 /DNA_ID=CAMNT_0042716869 /DNA_START=40 /DNA_END=627 /DNA_ORIENTATION=+